MLTETSLSQQQVESMSSSSNNFNKQLHFNQTENMATGQRQHEALASLFRSLSSLASANNDNHRQYPPHEEMLSLNLAPNNAGPMKQPSSTIANSIQSAVAAAMMQQHHQLNSQNPPKRPQLNASHHQVVAPSAYLCDQMKPAPNCQLLDRRQQQQQQLASGRLVSEVQFSTHPPPAPPVTTATLMTNGGGSQQPGQRINYCTICNKELCNKYFMKTHMLKMHGINLEMEQQTMGRVENGETGDEQAQTLIDDNCGQDGSQNQQDASDLSSPNTQPVDQRNSSSSSIKSPQKPVSKASGKLTQAVNKAGKTTTKQATSVLNGFAGNSMGGVVCDVCNKELCSKYFLKVHKQNTHGIMTDYQDAGQFVYPFAVNPLAAAAANSFMASAMPLPPVPSVLPFSTMCFNQVASSSSSSSSQMPANSDGCGPGCESGPSGHKRARTSGAEKTKRDQKQTKPMNSFSEFAPETGGEKALEPFYKLMLAQQQQQQQQQASGFDSINQMSAMMCYGAMGPFGSTARISPAMVVEMILRNQHLFNRNNSQQQNTNQSGRLSSKDKNNNGDPQRKGTGATAGKVNAKDPNNSRYFIHYTEACPMCDRRFKSIKWLKTHMMNDHKQEIGAYMQMMMQSMCPAKGQPAPNIIQEQHHNQPFNQPNACYPMGIGGMNVSSSSACTMLAQHLQLDSTPQLPPPPPVSLCTGQQQQQPPPSLSTHTTGLLQTIQSDHFSLIQNYLDQQRLVLQDQTRLNQTAINLSSPDSNQHRLATLNNLNIVKHNLSSSSSSASSSRPSSAKMSPHSMGIISNDDQQMDQLDLSIKSHNSDSQSCALDNGSSEFLQVNSSQTKIEINEFFDDDDDDDEDRSTRASSRHEQAASEANA